MNNPQMKNIGIAKTFLGDKLINRTSWELDYNGRRMNVNLLKNGKDAYFMKLNNRDIKQILGAKSFKQSLSERIENINNTRRNGMGQGEGQDLCKTSKNKKCKKKKGRCKKGKGKRKRYTRKNLGFMNF